MSTDPRDTQFKEFARLLWKELLQANGYGYIDVNEEDDPDEGGKQRPGYLTIIARRAYDLAYHVLYHNDFDTSFGGDFEQYKHQTTHSLSAIPDMTQWSGEENISEH